MWQHAIESTRGALGMGGTDFSDTVAIRMTRFFMRPIGFWISNNRRSKIMMKFALNATVAALAFAWSVVAMDLWHSRKRFDDLAYAACNTMTILVILTKFIVFSFKRDKFFDLIKFCYKHFWHGDYDSFGESVLQDCETRGIYCVCTFTFIALCVVFSYTLQPIVENMGRNGTDRVLPFKMYVNFPISETPYYEIAFITEILAMYHAGMIYFCFDNFLCIINIHVAGQFRILQRKLELLCNVHCIDDFSDQSGTRRNYNRLSMPLSNPRNPHNAELKACIRHHQSLIGFMKMVEDVYTLVVLSQVVIFSLLLCLTIYQAALAEGSAIVRRFIFVTHSCGTLNQIFMFTLTCDDVTQQSQDIIDAAYSAKWYYKVSNHEDRRFCKDLMVVMMRASRPCSLTAGGFAPVSLETFTAVRIIVYIKFTLESEYEAVGENVGSKNTGDNIHWFRRIISTSMSYLTMLRRSAE